MEEAMQSAFSTYLSYAKDFCHLRRGNASKAVAIRLSCSALMCAYSTSIQSLRPPKRSRACCACSSQVSQISTAVLPRVDLDSRLIIGLLHKYDSIRVDLQDLDLP